MDNWIHLFYHCPSGLALSVSLLCNRTTLESQLPLEGRQGHDARAAKRSQYVCLQHLP